MMENLINRFNFRKSDQFWVPSIILGTWAAQKLNGVPKIAAIILSILGFAYAVLGEYHKVINGDELDRKIYLDSLSITFSATLILIYILNFLTHYIDANATVYAYNFLIFFIVIFQWMVQKAITKKYRE